MTHSVISSDFCLSSAIDDARRLSVSEAVALHPEFQGHQALLTSLLEAMAAADRTEAVLAEQGKTIDQLSDQLSRATAA